MIDFQCTWWPDNWFGYSLTECCVQHDLTGDHRELLQCVSDIHWLLIPVAVIMFLGLIFVKPIIYNPIQKLKRK